MIGVQKIVMDIKALEVAIRTARMTGDREYADELCEQLETKRKELRGSCNDDVKIVCI